MTTNQCGKGWARRCAMSKGKKCRCGCGGVNHGRAPLGAEGNDRRHAHWDVVAITDEDYTIRDIGHLTNKSVTNDAEWVVEQIIPELHGRRLYYYDSMGNLDEIVVRGGRFAGFRPGLFREVAS